MVAEHIRLVEFDLRDAADTRKDAHRMLEAGFLALGEVDLRGVAGNDGFAVRPEAGEEHLHLGAGGVLRLVQDDEGPLERAPAHVGEGGNLDGPGLLVAAEFFGRQ